MTQEQYNRLMWHLTVPVCRTLYGLKIHIATISLCERWQLCYLFGVNEAPELVRILWNMIKGMRYGTSKVQHDRTGQAFCMPEPNM